MNFKCLLRLSRIRTNSKAVMERMWNKFVKKFCKERERERERKKIGKKKIG